MARMERVSFWIIGIVTLPFWLSAWGVLLVCRNLVVRYWPQGLGIGWQRAALVIWLMVIPVGIAMAWWLGMDWLMFTLLGVQEVVLQVMAAALGVGSYYYLYFVKPFRCGQWIVFLGEQHRLWHHIREATVIGKLELRIWWWKTKPELKRQGQHYSKLMQEGDWQTMADEMGEGIAGAAVALILVVMGVFLMVFIGGLVLIGILLRNVFGSTQSPLKRGKSLPKAADLRWFHAPSDGNWIEAYDYWLYQIENSTGLSLTTSPLRLYSGALLVSLVPAIGIGLVWAVFAPETAESGLLGLLIAGGVIGAITGRKLSQPAGNWFTFDEDEPATSKHVVTLGDWMGDE